MPTVNVNIGLFTCEAGTFYPDRGVFYNGDPAVVQYNPAHPYGADTYSALLIVGLAGQAGEKYTPKEIVEWVKNYRVAQVGDPGASFIFQKGVYRHKRTGKVVDEDSVRVIILNLAENESRDEFRRNILAMSEAIRSDFNQEEVILEFQRRGVTLEVFGITEK